MIQKFKLTAYLGALALAYIVTNPISAFAQMSSTTANSAFSTVVSDVSTSMSTNVVIILSVVAGLIALGWAYRKFIQKASGRKF